MDRIEYKNKLDSILADDQKFSRITKNPTNTLKININKLIAAVNKDLPQKVLSPITGEFSPGYLYGTVKTHKQGNPLRPIISQVPAPTYNVAKQLNNIISPYLPAKYQLSSTDDFLQIIKVIEPHGILASLDVESLFTNVPVATTIDIICTNVYNHPSIPPPPFNKSLLKKLLLACTTECPFTHIDGLLYLQKDGVSMGSPLSVTIANYYMTHLENKIIESNLACKPTIYSRFVDDCFIITKSEENLIQLKNAFESESVLKFTCEFGHHKQINFLDVHVEESNNRYITSVYQKSTNSGIFLNANSECPERYKLGTITALIHRAYKISSDWHIFNSTVDRLKQLFVNNGYSNKTFDNQLNKYLNKVNNKNEVTARATTVHKVYYQNQFSAAHKTDERILKEIVKNNTRCTNPTDRLQIITYYRSNTTTSAITKNNQFPSTTILKPTNVVYEYKCNKGDCELLNSSYIGMTTTTLSRRLTLHLAQGGPKHHAHTIHNSKRRSSSKYIHFKKGSTFQ